MKKYLILSAAVLAFAACQNNDDAVIESNDLVPLQVSVANLDVTQSVETRAANSAWEAGDNIGILAVKTGSSYTALATQCNPSNMKYQFNNGTDYETSGTTYRTFAANTTPVYLPANGDAIDVFAYYPWTDGVTIANASSHAINVADQTTQKNIDYMVTGRTSKTTQGGSQDIVKNYPTCQLKFRHALTKLQFNLKAGSGMLASDITGASPLTITIPAGWKTTANLDLFSGSITSLSGTGTAITPLVMATPGAWTTPTGTADKSFEAIVLPQEISATTATLTMGSATYTFTIPAVTYEAGNMYVYDITVNAASLTVTAAITPWVTNTATAVTAQ